MTQTTTANGWQPLIKIDRSRSIGILENSFYGSISRSFFLSSGASSDIKIQDNLMEIIYGADSLFFDFRQTSDVFIQNNTLKSSFSSPIKIRTSNFINLKNNTFQSASFEIWSVNGLNFQNNLINESVLFISDSIVIDFTFNEVRGSSIAFWKSARINISDNTFSNTFNAIQLTYSSDYTIENNLFINIENSNVLFNPPRSETSKLNTYLIVGSVMMNVVFGSLFIRNKFKT